MLAMAVPAIATVLIYDLKESWSEVDVYQGECYSYKGKSTAYFLVQITDPGKAQIRVVWFDKKEKEAWTENWGENSYIQATLEDGKEMVVVSSSGEEFRLLVNGASKTKKIAAYKDASCGGCHKSSIIGDIAPTVPASLSGYGIWDEIRSADERWMWTSKFTLKLNTKFTLKGHLLEAFDVNDAVDELLYFLGSEGYYIW